MKHILSIVLMALCFTSCEKVVDLKYKDNQTGIIIEGNIMNEIGPYRVNISKSVKLVETGAYPTVDNAVVVITDSEGNRENLVAKGNGQYSTTALMGVEGRAYTLTVQAEGQTYTAQSAMPQQVSFDSIKIEQVTVLGEIEYNIIPVYKDPIAKGNYYLFEMWINNKFIKQHFIQNDEVKNGVTNTERLEINDEDDDGLELKSGDTIRITMKCVGAKVGLFYKTLALMTDSGPGGGTTPNNPPNNFSNGALGLFSAHTIETKTAVIP